MNQLKSKFYIIQKGTNSVDKYMLKLKGIKDQLVFAGENITDNDFIIAAIYGLPLEFEVIKTIIFRKGFKYFIKRFFSSASWCIKVY